MSINHFFNCLRYSSSGSGWNTVFNQNYKETFTRQCFCIPGSRRGNL